VVRDAKAVLAERTSIIENAKQEHKRILETAERRAQELIREDVIVKEAQSEAESIIARARAEAEELKREALLYTEELLETLSKDFQNAIETVNNGRRLIRKFLEKTKETSSTAPLSESVSGTEQS
jgi:vacuolar-type H+-ATPase subunit H